MSSRPSIFSDPGAALRQARRLLASDPAAAVRQARQLLAADPGNPALLRLLGAGLRRTGADAAAEKAELEAIAASTKSPGHQEAARAIAAGNPARASVILKHLLAEDDTDVVALVMLGLQASQAKKHAVADPLLHKAVALAPADPSARLALAEHLHRSKRAAKALDELDQLRGEAVRSEGALALRAAALKDIGRQDEEVELLEQLMATAAKPERYRIRLGHALRTLGRIDEAVAAYRAVLAKQPWEGTAWWSLANLKTVRFSDEDIAAMEQGLEHPQAPLVNRIRLQFALGKAHEDRGQPEAAFRHYAEGNRLRMTIADYKPEKTRNWVANSVDILTPEFFAERKSAGCKARDPIFVVGIQRSGSTLVEQILASHPQIEGTAELTDLPNIAREMGEQAARRGMPFKEYLPRLETDELSALGQSYLDRTRVHRKQGRPLFTDKMPNNWMHVGLIRLILPNARIIDVRRHPLACGFSNWKQLYGKGLEHSYSMENMGLYYAEYVRLMRHFDDVQPGAVHRVVYERLVEDVETEVRRLLDYLDVPFDRACLDFHANERSVRTISAEQVRRPINREGLDQWRAYEQWLEPMKQALGSALEGWDRQ